MRVAVFGGAGYIGSVLVRELLTRGHEVLVYDTLFFGSDGLTEIRDRIELRTCDLRAAAESDLDGVEGVINLAGISSDPTAEFRPEATWEMNVSGAVRLAQLCKRVGATRYVFASSCSVYDRNDASDEADVLQDERSQVAPVATYARSKLEAERGILSLTDHKFSPVALRKGTVFGLSPRMRFDLLINTLLKDALSTRRMTLRAGGEMWRPVVEVRDAARAYARCLEAQDSQIAGQVFNIVLGNFRVSEMAFRIRNALLGLGVQSDICADYSDRPGRSYRVSGRKAGRHLGFWPRIGIGESVRTGAAELLAQRHPQFDDPRYYNIRVLELLDVN